LTNLKHQKRILAVVLVTIAVALVERVPSAQQRPVFRSGRDVISVDVIVRDRTGAVVRGLTATDFEIREDGRPQAVASVTFEAITARPLAAVESAGLLADVEARMAGEAGPGAAPANADAAGARGPMTSDMLAGRRLITLVFDVSSMQPEDVQRAVDSARKYIDETMSAADLVAIVTVGSSLSVLTDFSSDRAAVTTALGRLAFTEGTATAGPAASTAATDEAAAIAEDEVASTDAAELDMFNNDVRLRALKTLAEAMSTIEQKKAILYFSAGMQRSGQDNQVELRSAINAAVRANVAIYPVDTRGLQAVVPGGDARQASGRGTALFSGRGVQQQFAQLASSQDTLTSLAADTGGRAFTDSNDFGEAFARVQRDMSAYYLLGYSSTNATRDGRFRRIQVRVKNGGYRVEARAGYYADRDFTHTSRNDREAQLEEQMFAAVSATDLPVMVSGGWFRLTPDKYYVPIALTVPGSAVPVASATDQVSLDVLGLVRDERDFPVGRFRETLKLPPGSGSTLGGKQVLYQSGVTLPPGRFSVKVVVRENANGRTGSFEAPVIVPELKQAALKVSSVVLSTQLQPAGRGRTDNPLVRDGIQLLPNLTHVVGRDQKLFFYYEVYDPGQSNGAPQLRTSLAFYRGRVKVFETPVVERTTIDVPERHAALFQFEVPAGSFTPGLYTCQINIIDAVAGKFEFPRMIFAVR
jgi:VWFA-related protein